MGGGQRFALRLARHVAKARGHDSVVVVCPQRSSLAEAARQAEVSVAAMTFPDPRVTNLLRLPPTLIKLRGLIGSIAPTTLVGNSARCQLYGALAMAGLRRRPRLVALMHEQDSAGRAALRILYQHIGSLEVVGRNAAIAYRVRLPGVDVHQVNNFLTAAEFEQLRSLRRPRRTEPTRQVLGVLGRLIPEKGLIELVEELAAVGHDAWGKLVIAAMPEQLSYERRLRERIAELALEQRVTLLGQAADAGRFLAETDVVIVPSTGNEGQPTVILEALATGRPVIVRRQLYSADYAGLPVTPFEGPHDLRTALLAPPEPVLPDELVQARFGVDQVLTALERPTS